MEIGGGDVYDKSLVPHLRGLLEAIQSLKMMTNLIMKLRVNITRRLPYVNTLSKITMKEDIFNIKLMNGPIFGTSDAKNNTNSSRFNHEETEGVIKI